MNISTHDLGLPWSISNGSSCRIVNSNMAIVAECGSKDEVLFILSAIAQRDEVVKALRHLLNVCITEQDPSIALESVTADYTQLLAKLETSQP